MDLTQTLKKSMGIIALVTLSLLPNIAFAATADGLGFTESSISAILPVVTIVFSLVIQLMFLALQVLEAFLRPEFILAINSGGAGGGDGPLLDVWQVSRDIVNVLFAMLLVVVAIYTIFRANYTMAKEHAGKFVLAVILVNFSWFGPRVVLDFANVLTATVYSMPSIVDNEVCHRPDPADNTKFIKCLTIEEIHFYEESAALAAVHGATGGNEADALKGCYENKNGLNGEQYLLVNETICLKTKEFDPNDTSGYFGGLIANYTKILMAGKIPSSGDLNPGATISGDPARIGELMQFVLKLFLNFVLTAALAFPLMAMAVILFVRIFVLWLTIAFMPFAFIGFVIGDKMGSANPMIIWEKFWKNALLPAVLAVPFCVGFIMLNALVKNGCPFKGHSVAKLAQICEKSALPVTDVSTWWQFIWYMMAIGVIYYGFFTATKFDSIAEKIGGFFKGFGDLAMKAPLALPIPTGLTGGKKINGFQATNLSSGTLEQKLKNFALASSPKIGGQEISADVHTKLQTELKASFKNNTLDTTATNQLKQSFAEHKIPISESSLKELNGSLTKGDQVSDTKLNEILLQLKK